MALVYSGGTGDGKTSARVIWNPEVLSMRRVLSCSGREIDAECTVFNPLAH